MAARTPRHATRPDSETPRCPGPFGKGHVTTSWDQVVDERAPGSVTCPACVEDIRNGPRPRWLDDRLFAGEQPGDT